jgi:hypothetical protein
MRERYFVVIARSEATKQSRTAPLDWIASLRFARNDESCIRPRFAGADKGRAASTSFSRAAFSPAYQLAGSLLSPRSTKVCRQSG